MQIGSLIAFLAYLLQILMSVMMATFMAIMIPRAAVCAERIGEVLDTESSVVPAARPCRVPAARRARAGRRRLRLSRRRRRGAHGRLVHRAPGQTTAIIGSTGAGKTTLLSLIPRLVDATAGSVRVDGVDVRDLAPEVLWRRIGLVPQKPYLFTGTVASNLRYGDPDATDEQLWQALEIAQARDFVEAMPQGLEHADRPGRHQRLRRSAPTARASPGRWCVKPEIYLFDDSFSALDLATDARLRAALRPHTRDATVVIVAQRVSTIIDADQIIVLEDGTIAGVGTHEELLETLPDLRRDRRSPSSP